MSVYFYNEDVSLPSLNYDVLKNVLKNEIRRNGLRLGEINYIFCSDNYLLDLNIKFLNHNFYTDVITFDYSENNIIAGDIYISTERVLNNSVIFEQNYSNELIRVISHGLLHLLKYNDKELVEIELMRMKESEIMNKYFTSITTLDNQ